MVGIPARYCRNIKEEFQLGWGWHRLGLGKAPRRH